MSYLVACRDALIHRVVPLGWAPLLVGSSVTVPHLLLPGGAICGTHLRFVRDDLGVKVVNLAQQGALRINDKATEGKRLTHGDLLSIGDWRLTYIEVLEREPASGGREERDLLEAWFRMGKELGVSAEPSVILERMLDALMQVFGAERGFILLANDADKELHPAISRHIDEEDLSRMLSKTVVAQVVAERRCLAVGDADERWAGAASVEASNLRSIICAPLGSESGQLLGVLYLDSRVAGRTYGDRDVALLEAFALHGSLALEAALERQQLRTSNHRLRALRKVEHQDYAQAHGLVGRSEAMLKVFEQIDRVAPETVTTLILGESGTGKELVARAIHEKSQCREGPFVAVHCMALSPQVVESELFGHEKGAFTGAEKRRIGRFELAHKGTLFLDEIGELSFDIQVKLLRVLQERIVERVGSSEAIPVDVRVIAATNSDLKRACLEGRFREDLYYRLSVFSMNLPPLRQRIGDVSVLAKAFANEFASARGRNFAGFTPDVIAAFNAYPWPGNVRELRNVIERAFVLERGETITRSSLPSDILGDVGIPSRISIEHCYPSVLAGAREIFEKDFILSALARHKGNVAGAARELGIPRSTIYRKCKVWGKDPKGE